MSDGINKEIDLGIKMNNNEQSVKDIKKAMNQWAEALKKKDLEEMHKDYAQNYRLFDVEQTANSVEEVKALWQHCFPFFDQPEIEYKNMVIEATDTMAVVYFNSRIKGMISAPKDMSEIWLRGTVILY